MRTRHLALAALLLTLAASLPPLSQAVESPRLASGPDTTLHPKPSATANGDSQLGRFSRDGRWLVFVSSASNLVTNDTNGSTSDVFLRDLSNGQTARISSTPAGLSGDGDSYAPDITADGRFVVFASQASNLVSDDTNDVADVFLYDRTLGSIRRISVSAGGAAADAECFAPRITPDGRFVGFGSRASNLDPLRGDTDGRIDVFVRDLVSGETKLASAEARETLDGQPAFDVSDYALSDDGTWVAFATASTNVVVRPSGGIASGAFVHDRSQNRTYGIEVDPAALAPFSGTLEAQTLVFARGRARLAISAWGVTRTIGISNVVLVLDLEAQGPKVIATLPGAHALTIDAPVRLAFSDDGESLALVQPERNGQPAVLRLWHASTGLRTLTGGPDGKSLRAREVALSPNAGLVAFTSLATDILPADPPVDDVQLYLLEIGSGRLERLTAGPSGQPLGGAEESLPQFSPDGRWLAFVTATDRLIPDDRNHRSDIVLRDLQAGTNRVVSSPAPGSDAWAGTPSLSSLLPEHAVSADGRRILFSSTSDELVAHDAKGLPDLFVRDLVERRTLLVTVPGATGGPSRPGYGEAVLSGNGRFVAFTADLLVIGTDGSQSLGRQVFVRDLALESTRTVGVGVDGQPAFMRTASTVRISADGRYVAFVTDSMTLVPNSFSGGKAVLRDTVLGKTWVITNATINPAQGFQGPQVLLAGLGGRVLASRGGTRDLQGMLFDPVTERGEPIRGDLSASAALSYDGRRVVVLEPAIAAAFPPLLRWRAVDETEWQSFTPALERDLTYRLQALSRDGRSAVIQESSLTNAPPPQRRSTAIVDVENRSIRRLELQPHGALSTVPSSASVGVSADARRAAFRTTAPDLTAPVDPDTFTDVFWQETDPHHTSRVERRTEHPADFPGISGPAISADGRVLAFGSWSSTYAPNDWNPMSDVFTLRLPAIAFSDTDTDRLEDLWERTWFGNLSRDGTGDYDGDGASEFEEYAAGTCPIDETNRLVVEGRAAGPESLTLQWAGQPERVYRVSRSAELGGPWAVVGDPILGNGATARVTLPLGISDNGYYRIHVAPVPVE